MQPNEQTVARLDSESNVPFERVVKQLPVVILALCPSNEAVHQNSTFDQIAPRAVSGTTVVVRTRLFI